MLYYLLKRKFTHLLYSNRVFMLPMSSLTVSTATSTFLPLEPPTPFVQEPTRVASTHIYRYTYTRTGNCRYTNTYF